MASPLDLLLGGLPGAVTAAASGDPLAALQAFAQAGIGRVEVSSNVSPTVVVDDPLAPSSAPPNPIMQLIRPEVRVYDPSGRLIVAVAPYGEPTDNYLPYLLVGGALLALGAWVGGAWLMRRFLP